jgi:predicted enzyme related to lactoylglutathione lyase
MKDIRPASVLTRRAVVTLIATVPGLAQSKNGGKNMGAPVVHFEIGCRDLAKTEHFFSELFGWKTQRSELSANIDTASSQGVQGHMTALGHEPQHYTIFYVEVDDLKACLDKVASLGGKTLVPPVKIPTGTFAWFADPEGNTIGLLQRKP